MLSQAHDAPLGGHLGGDKTMSKIMDVYYWVNMRRDVRQYCQACDQCTARKPVLHHHLATMKSFVVGSPMERVTTDIIGQIGQLQATSTYCAGRTEGDDSSGFDRATKTQSNHGVSTLMKWVHRTPSRLLIALTVDRLICIAETPPSIDRMGIPFHFCAAGTGPSLGGDPGTG